jgi:hypothetical protein
MSQMHRNVARVAALLAAGVLVAGCAGPQGSLPQEGGQGAVTAGQDPQATAPGGEETGVTGPQPDDEQTGEASAECLDAVRAAEEQQSAGEGGDPTGVSTEESDLLGQDDGTRPNAALFPAFDACQDVDEFRAATSGSDGVLRGEDPADFVVVTCEREEAVQGTSLCESAAGSEEPFVTGEEGTDEATADG